MKKIILFIALFLSLSANAWDDCPLDKPIKWIDNKCYTCDIARDLVKNSSGVPLDIMNELEMFCKCPADKPIFWLDGQCVTCDEARENIFKQKGKFSEQKMKGLQQLSYLGIMADIDKFCAALKCSADKPALWTDGNCYTCSEIEQKVKKLPKQLSGMEGLHRGESGTQCGAPDRCSSQQQKLRLTKPEFVEVMHGGNACHLTEQRTETAFRKINQGGKVRDAH